MEHVSVCSKFIRVLSRIDALVVFYTFKFYPNEFILAHKFNDDSFDYLFILSIWFNFLAVFFCNILFSVMLPVIKMHVYDAPNHDTFYSEFPVANKFCNLFILSNRFANGVYVSIRRKMQIGNCMSFRWGWKNCTK